MKELYHIIDDIGKGRYLESYVGFILSLVIAILGFIDQVSVSVLNAMVLLVLGNLLYISIIQRRQRDGLLKTIDGINHFGINRESLSPLGNLLDKAREEIILVAVQHSTLVHQYLGVLQRKVEMGCKIKILMMAAKDQERKDNANVPEFESHHPLFSGLRSQIERTSTTFTKWLRSLPEAQLEKIEIRSYVSHPIATYTFIDKDHSEGFVQVEVLLYGLDVNDLPHYIVGKATEDERKLLKTHCESFDRLWESATPFSL